MRKILTRLRGTNFCTSSARFPPSFVRQPSGPECTQIVQNIPKHQFRVQWGGLGVFLAKNSYATSCHELLHLFKTFCPEFCKATKWSQNARKWYEMHQNMSLGSNGVHRVGSLQKILTRLRGTNFCTSSACFSPSFVRQHNCPKCTQMVRNTPKHEFRVQWGGSGAFVSKNSNATSWHKLLH